LPSDAYYWRCGPDGERSFAISPADPSKTGQHFLTIKEDGHTYIIPDGVDLQKVDKELFNIDYLIDEAYYGEPSLPVLVSYVPSLAKSRVQSLKEKIRALGRQTKLHSEVNIISTRLAYKGISASYNNLMRQPEIERVRLDKKFHALLIDSVRLIGADWWWEFTGNKGEGVEIAILDTGIDSSHPALDDLDDNPETNDPKVIVNVNFSDDASFDDLFGHGTHCAGIAAGTAAGGDYQGVAPGAQLWNVKVLNQWGMGYESWIINGINFASLGADGVPETGDEADVISMSLGGPPSDGTDPVSQAVNLAVERGLVVVVAAGNEGGWGPCTISSPGVAEKVITVGASDKADILADFSSLGPTMDLRIKPDILAPGVDITSSVPGGGYESHSGTSMATPHVAGAAALLQQYYGDTVSPQLIKDTLMYTAEDLGYTVYEQGSGRLELAWELWPIVGVTPASVSMGLLTPELPMPAPVFTFFNEDTSSHSVTLTVSLINVINGDDYSGSVHLDPASFSVPPSGEIDVSLTIPDLASLPASIYGGRVTATVDNGMSKTIHAIFGFAKMREVTVHKTDINGQPAQGHPVWVVIDSPIQGIWEAWQETDEQGNFTFYAIDGNYHLVSPNWWHEQNQVTIWTIAENVAISGDMAINLDERNTRLVDFDPNKAGQVAAGKSSGLYYDFDYGRGHAWSSRWWYPSSFLTRVSPISRFAASFSYSYYPEADFIPDNAFLVNTDEWHNLRYSVTEISADTTFIADYPNLVQQRASYSVALNAERAEWAQFSSDDVAWWPSGFIYSMDAPQERSEWLSPEPVRYSQWYAKAEPRGEWYFDRYMSYPAGEYQCRIGGHPLTSGMSVSIWGNELDIYGPISRDSANNDFCNQQARFSGHITVKQDSEVVFEDDIWDHFVRWLEFEGAPHFTVEVWGETPLELSPHSYTRLDFIADLSHDYRPPRVRFRVPGINLFGVAPGGEVKVMVEVTDESRIDSVHLHYSLDDGDTWNDAGLPIFEGGWYTFNLGWLQETFVTIAVDAEDEYGNHIHRNTNRAFYVPLVAPPLPHAFYGAVEINGNPAPIGTEVEARGEGVITGIEGNPIVTTEVGRYGSGADPLGQKLIVQGDIVEGTTLRFYVNDVVADQTAEWHSGEVTELDLTVTTAAAVTVSINAPDQVAEDSDFTATVDIGEVVDLNSAQYDVLFDSTVLRLDDITSGQIDGREIPVAFSEVSPGIWRVVQTMGLDTVSGSGSLAVLHFHVIGSTGESSAIDLSNGMLSGLEGEIPSIWVGGSVEVGLPGDANGDGVINVLDITKVVRIILGLDAETAGADANGDGQVNVLDITKIVRIILGLD